MARKSKKALPEPKCDVTLRASVKRRGAVAWQDIAASEIVSAGDEVEIFVGTTCKAFIDIKPDNSTPIATIKWATITFAPPRNMCSRFKVAYYRASKVSRATQVTFFARARCSQCGECDGMDMREVALSYVTE